MDEQDEFRQDVYFGCEDITGDGLGDLVMFDDLRNYGIQAFINEGNEDLVKTAIRGIETLEDRNSRAIFVDVNGDGIGDLVQFFGFGVKINYGNRRQLIDGASKHVALRRGDSSPRRHRPPDVGEGAVERLGASGNI